MKREIILAKNAIKPLQKEARSQDTNMSIQVRLYIRIENLILSFVLVLRLLNFGIFFIQTYTCIN